MRTVSGQDGEFFIPVSRPPQDVPRRYIFATAKIWVCRGVRGYLMSSRRSASLC